MIKKTVLFLVLAIALVIVGFSTYTASNWIQYTSKEGQFQILFPRAPRHAVTKLPFRSPSELVTYDNYVARGDDETLYLLTTALYPISPDGENAKAYLEKFVLQLVTNSRQNKILKLQHTLFESSPAIDFTLLNKEFWTYGRAIFVGNKMFILLVSNFSDAQAQQNFKTFAGSLRLLQDSPSEKK